MLQIFLTRYKFFLFVKTRPRSRQKNIEDRSNFSKNPNETTSTGTMKKSLSGKTFVESVISQRFRSIGIGKLIPRALSREEKRSGRRRAQREWHKGARCGCRRFYLSPRAMHRVCTTNVQRLASLSSRSLRILALLWYADDVAKFSSAPALISSILRESTVTTRTNLFLSLYGDADNDSLSKAKPDNDTFDCTREFH